MKVSRTPLAGCLILETEFFVDDRGYFQETFHLQKYNFLPPNTSFVQDNLSNSKKNVLRGIHFQKNFPQGKLVRVVQGSVFDVAVDLRPNSKTFGRHFSINLSDSNRLQLWIPEGFGHAFLSLEDNTIVEYKCTNFYNPDDEKCIIWNDSEINIAWPNNDNDFLISKKDLLGKSIHSYNFEDQ